MLVLSRKIGESVQIGEDITVTVVDIDRNKIRLGIVAPLDVPIYRSELDDNHKGDIRAKHQEGSAAASKPAPDQEALDGKW